MFTFKEFIEESFDSSFSVKKMGNSHFSFNDIHVKIHNEKLYGGGDSYEIEFYKLDEKDTKVYNLVRNTNTGTAIKTLSTINRIIEDYLRNIRMKAGDIISFKAYDKKTINLYNRFAKSLSNKFKMEMAASDEQFMLMKI